MSRSPSLPSRLRRLLGAFLMGTLTATPVLAQPAPEPLFGAEVAAGARAAGGRMAGGAAAGADLPQDVPPRRAHAVPGRERRGRLNPSAFRAERLSVTLPDGRVLVAERQQDTRGRRDEQTWTGTFEGAPESLLVLTRHRGAVTGFFHHGAETYEVEGFENGSLVLFQVDEDALPQEGEPLPAGDTLPDQRDGAEPDAGGVGDVLAHEAAMAGDPFQHDLLVVYTQRSVNQAGGVATLEAKIVNAVAAANAAYANSGINIRLNLVGMSLVDYTETGDMGTTLQRLRLYGDGYMDSVHALRNQLGADLVSLVSDESNYCGLAYVMTTVSTSFASSAFSVVTQSCFSQQTLAHEIGHNQGNAHDRPNGSQSAYPYSYGYRTCDNIAPTNGQKFRTVMGYPCSNVPRVNYFSNPNVFYNGAPMGVAYESNPSVAADNARSMNNTAAVVAAFRTPPASPPAAPTELTATAVTQ
jgi:hypothetical protein